ncbi:unnamed protein product [Caenorhabditis bovis]|uniref:Uncharacterized protein n=1 Tax=Caenorhabditis bovis TaxID=2654633 RepID=A0A8S1F6H6_9PELO|nr:unnamed protein product [Caenorhabditis bovis]
MDSILQSDEKKKYIDVNRIIEKIEDKCVERDRITRQQTETIRQTLNTWQSAISDDEKEFAESIALLEKRKEQIRQDSIQMLDLAEQLRQMIEAKKREQNLNS